MAKKRPKFQPYTMHCPKCKTGIRIKKKELIGTRINCPKCTKKIDIVTPEEDGYVPYGVEHIPEPEPDPEPTEEELLEIEMKKKKEKRAKAMVKTRYAMGVLWYVVLLGAVAYAFWHFIIKDYGKDRDEGPPAPAMIYTERHLA